MKIFVSYAAADRERAASLINLVVEAGHSVDTVNSIVADSIASAVAAQILSAQIIVAVLSSTTPFMYFELGIAVGAGLPVLLVADSNVKVPADLAAIPFVRLTGDLARDSGNVLRQIDALKESSRGVLVPSGSSTEMLDAVAKNPQLLDRISSLDFERMVGDLLLSQGWTVERSAKRNRVEFDLILSKPGQVDVTVVEVKKFSSQGRVSVDTVRQLLSKMTIVGVRSGLLISATGFTHSAIAMAAGTGAVLVTLQDLVSEAKRFLLEKGRENSASDNS